jgi:HPr kinase/phosphorylase
MIAELVEWREDEEYDRLGLDDRIFTILDVELPLITVPVRAGRNMGVIIEVAARNQLLKNRGRNSAVELHEKLARELARGRARMSDVD